MAGVATMVLQPYLTCDICKGRVDGMIMVSWLRRICGEDLLEVLLLACRERRGTDTPVPSART